MLNEPWHITLFGGLSAQSGERVITRFSTRKTAAQLAYLAIHCSRTHPREELIERFWPEVERASGRVSLRQALASLRRHLEEPPIPPGSVLIADRSDIRLQASVLTTDVEAFETALRAADAANALPACIEALRQADALYRGDLLPGFYEDWILLLRERLAEAHRNALRQLAAAYQQSGEMERAIDSARFPRRSDVDEAFTTGTVLSSEQAIALARSLPGNYASFGQNAERHSQITLRDRKRNQACS